ncbi:MAG: hypothetical protein P8O91_06540 [Luminiphilus sp.]|nr:hypothetical protein [Luminiphilus sp.]
MAETKAKAPARKTPAKKAVASKKVAPKKAAAKKTAAKKAPVKAAAAKTRAKRSATTSKTAARDLRSVAVETSRNALRAGLGVYGMAYDQVLEQLEQLQSQVDDAQGKLNERRKQAEAVYETLVKRGTAVEKDALKAFEDLELDALTDRTMLDEQMSKAKARFDDLRAKVTKAA